MMSHLSGDKAAQPSGASKPDLADAPLDTSLIHAYDAPLLPTPPALASAAPHTSHGRLGSRASNLLCCFTSAAGYYIQQRDEVDPDALESASTSDWGTGELRIFDAAPCTRAALLAPMAPEHSGRATLVLDLDGAPIFSVPQLHSHSGLFDRWHVCDRSDWTGEVACTIRTCGDPPASTAPHSVVHTFAVHVSLSAPAELDGHATHAETLVHSSFRPVPNADFVLTVNVNAMIMHVYVMKRPWLDVFLQQAAKMFEVVVFTASLGQYADAVLDHVDPLGTVSRRLYRESCILHGGSYVKDLARIGRPLDRTILVDNALHSYAFQPANGLHSSTFVGDKSDSGLLEIMAVLLQVKDAPDVRPALQRAISTCGYSAKPCLE